MVIIADDFTGAMDTGVQFVKQGIATLVTSQPEIDFDQFEPDLQVLAINTDSRHDPPDLAYRKVSAVVRQVIAAGIRYLYKKTDSALRGNVGAELEAVMRETGTRVLPFVPAYPMNNRITIEGCQYVDGLPVNLSKPGKDIFTPVESALIAEVIHKQSNVPVRHTTFWKEQLAGQGICVYNASSNEELARIGQTLTSRGQIAVTAGCAGFAEFLPEILGLEKQQVRPRIKPGNLLIVSGSVNEISIYQIKYMTGRGLAAVALTDIQDESDLSGLLEQVRREFDRKGIFILESVKSVAEIDKNAERLNGNRIQAMNKMAHIVKAIITNIPIQTLAVIGGDTLQKVMEELNIPGIIPVGELIPGVVLGNVKGSELQIISKSGGFGSESVLEAMLGELEKLQERS